MAKKKSRGKKKRAAVKIKKRGQRVADCNGFEPFARKRKSKTGKKK